MDTLFEAKRVMTKQLALEIAKNAKPLSFYVYFILMFTFTIGTNLYNIFYRIYYYGYFSIDIYGIILLALLIAYYFYRPVSMANNRIKRYQELYKATETDLYYFYDDHFINIDENSRNQTKIEYTRISDVKCTKNAYIIKLTDSKTMIEMPKNDFTKGTTADFIEFINSRTINSKRKFK